MSICLNTDIIPKILIISIIIGKQTLVQYKERNENEAKKDF